MFRRLLIIAGLAGLAALPATASAQNANPDWNHGTVSAYGDLFRIAPSGAPAVNYLGLGGRVGLNVDPWVALEAEMNYDFVQSYTTTSSSGGQITTFTAKVRPLTGLFGPKFQFGASGPVRAFVVGKVGFVDFSTSCNAPAGSPSCFTGSLSGFGGSSTHVAVYPGGGFEFFGGPIGVRIEAGDQIYWNNGTNNNLRVTFGPTFRF
ncbi:MAG TPA: outer membrane beta-barrel protein [Terracidiphilus sp.]|jgi:hypothetical protein|nr:outer membrane beta-barrel protein [Terracidiphilus sp.]